jgi:formylglycine-generating enzyme required for sulfatase activity/serine/threonine protein kinase
VDQQNQMNCTTVDAKVDIYYSSKDPAYEYHLKSKIKHKVFIAEDLLKKREENIELHAGARQLPHHAAEHHWTVVLKLGDKGENLKFAGEYKILRILADAGLKASAHILRPQRVVLENTALWKEGNSEKYSECNHPPFMVLPYIPQARDFRRLVHAGHKGEEFTQQWSAVLFDLLALLEKCGIIHRDISPSNVLIDTHNKLYLIDFGSALSQQEKLENLHFSGTHGYMAPEVMEEREQLTTAADQYSLAAVFLYLLTGIEPINVGAGNNLQNLYAALADDLRPVLQKAMAEKPQDRYATAEAFRKAWERVFTNRAHSAEQKKQREFDEKIRLEVARAKAEFEKKPKPETPTTEISSTATQTTPAVNRQTHWGSRLVWLALLTGIGVLAYPQLKAKLQPVPVQVSASLIRTQEGDVILKRDSGFDLTSAPYQLNLPQKGECHYRETQSHPAGGLLAYRCTAETAGEQEWKLLNARWGLVANGYLTVAPEKKEQHELLEFNASVPRLLEFKPKIAPSNAQIALNGKPYQSGKQIPEGKYQLEVSAPGYITQSLSLQLPDQNSIALNLRPTLQDTEIKIRPVNSRIRVTGAKLYAQELQVPDVYHGAQNLPLGTYQLEVSALNYQSQQVTLDVSSEHTANLSLELIPNQYRLANKISPANARVEYEGETIELSHQNFLAGSFTFLISHPDYHSKTVEVEIGEREVNQLVAVLEKKEAPKSTVVGQLQTTPTSSTEFYEPEMVDIIPAGTFDMGDLTGNGDRDEKPILRGVRIKAFRMSKYETTFKEYDAYARATANSLPDDEKWGRDNRPVINVSWESATAYAKWLSEKTGKKYRLPSEYEWEYAARAGTKSDYSWSGQYVGKNQANCDGCGGQWDNKSTAPVGSFSANKFGLYDLHGNVWEWVEDCWNYSYKGAPVDGSAWLLGDCDRRVMRGGSWFDHPSTLRVSNRGHGDSHAGFEYIGFRLVQEIESEARQPYEPEMVTIPANSFMMGDDKSNWSKEKPAHRVNIKSFKMSKYEATFAEYDAYAKTAGKALPRDEGWGRSRRPVVNVSWADAAAYANWLSEKTGKKYRLPTEAEWEYAAKAGAKTDYNWGNNKADCDSARYSYHFCGSRSTAEVGSYAPNASGLYDMPGNVWEWVQDCYHENYKAAPAAVRDNGAAWEDNGSQGKCNSGSRVLRGGSWFDYPHTLRSAYRGQRPPTYRDDSYGFRLVQDI